MQHDFTDVIAGFAERHPCKLKFRGMDFPQWQELFMSRIQSLRGRGIERVPLTWSKSEKQDATSHWRTKVTIEATEYSSITGWFLEPKNLTAPAPAILASHGHGDCGKETVAGHPSAAHEIEQYPDSDYGRRAVEAGYPTFVPDWWGWSDRSGHRKHIGNRDKCNVIQMAASMYGISVLNLHLLEADAVIDFLRAQNNVKPDRIGVIGNSYGGRTAMWIAALNPNVACTVAAGSMNLFRERASVLLSCAIQFFPGILEYGDVGEIFSLISPRPLMMQAGTSDPLINTADRDEISAVVRQAYDAANASQNLEIDLFEGGHAFHWSTAAQFLSRHLCH